ncbi:MAG: ribosome biogenesis GTP-binding protein YsxC [Elusimicrobia bacterium]|nr:ribosome biogenesis GTP-binding protein YsxC [Elusimicrobiota bacterium]
MLNHVQYLISETNPGNLGPSTAEVSFVGRSNVGKSTLLNALCGHVLARVSKTPGRTRMINVFSAGKDRWLVDLPGYGYAVVPKNERREWGPMIEGYLTGRANLRMIFCLIDAKVGPTPLDTQMHEWLISQNLPWRIVATKADQVRSSLAKKQRQDIAHVFGLQPNDIAWVSASKGLGIQELKTEVSRLLTSQK